MVEDNPHLVRTSAEAAATQRVRLILPKVQYLRYDCIRSILSVFSQAEHHRAHILQLLRNLSDAQIGLSRRRLLKATPGAIRLLC